MKITDKHSQWFSFLFEFEYDSDVVSFCQSLKRKYGYDMINFVKEKDWQGSETIGWGFNNETIYNEIIAKYPNTETLIDTHELIETKLEPISPEPITEIPENIDTKTKLELYPFQKRGVNFILKTDGKCMVADEMGLGKTIQAITYSHLNNFKTLVICPASLKLVWQGEIEKFTDRTSLVLYANKMDMTDIDKYDFVITNYEIIEKALQNGLNPTNFDAIICDESTYIKNPRTKRTKQVKKLKSIPHRILLTGTPILNRPSELWSQLDFIEPKMFGKEWGFYFRYCGATKTRFGWDISGHSHLDELGDRLNGIVLRRLKKDVLPELPPKIETIIKIELSDKMRKEYYKLYNEFESEIATDRYNQSVELAELTYLKQFLSINKLEPTMEIIDNIIESGQKVVLFSQYLNPLHFLHEKYPQSSVVYEGKMNERDKEKSVKSFQTDDNVKIFLGSIMASGMGITLTKSQTAIFLDLPWTPAIIAQGMDRIHRIGQKGSVNIYYLLTPFTIEEDIYSLVHEKIEVISELLNEGKIIKMKNQSILKDFLNIIKKKKYQQPHI